MTRILNDIQLDAVAGGITAQQVALNPQPIPPGRFELGSLHAGLSLTLPRNPGCPGPRLLPPSPC
jgi:hypothetical protein